LIAWNRYDGWYENQPNYLGQWLDKTHAENPKFNIGISEYGAGSSVNHQQDTLVKSVPNSSWHPENWQTYFHMENWKAIAERQFVWGSFIWNLFDFGAAHRNEGDRPGINDKGLVSFDRKIKKDAFYFYKANWNKKVKTVYISNKRDVWRKSASPSVMVFANTTDVELIVNGKSYGKKSPDNYSTVVWKNITLVSGKNQVIAKSKINGQEITDACEWIVEDSQVRLVSAK
jgi:beta-galactosidase